MISVVVDNWGIFIPRQVRLLWYYTFRGAKASLATADANLQKAQTATDEASLEAIAVAQGQVSIAKNEANEAKTAVATAQSAEKTSKDVADKFIM